MPEENKGQIVTAEDGENSGNNLEFGGNTKSETKLKNEMVNRGWTEKEVSDLVDSPYAKRDSVNKANGNSATVYYNKDGSYVVVDNGTHEVIQVSGNRTDPTQWIPDSSIIDPYIPGE